MSIRLLAFCETDCARIEQRYVDGQPVLPGNENERSDSHSPRPGADGSGSPQRLKQILGVVALLVTIAGGAKALWPHHTSAVTAYRNKLEKEVCLGDLAAAARSNNPSVYASEDGAIDKGAWLSAMDNTRNHLKQGLDR